MNIASLLSSIAGTATGTLGSGQTSSQATGAANPVAKAMAQAEARIQGLQDSTTAQLSSFGQLKLAVSDVQDASQSLGAITASTSVAAVRAAASNWVDSINAAMDTANTSAALPGSSAADSGNAHRVVRDLDNALFSNFSTADALKKIGITRQSDGSVSIDAKVFDAAQAADPAGVQATLAQVAQQVHASATNELANGGVVSNSIASLTQRGTTLTAEQTAIQKLVDQFATGATSDSTSSSGLGSTSSAANYTSSSLSSYLWPSN